MYIVYSGRQRGFSLVVPPSTSVIYKYMSLQQNGVIEQLLLLLSVQSLETAVQIELSCVITWDEGTCGYDIAVVYNTVLE